MYKKLYCQYCGEPLENGCKCEIEAAREEEERLSNYYCDRAVTDGWHQQDIIDMYKRER